MFCHWWNCAFLLPLLLHLPGEDAGCSHALFSALLALLESKCCAKRRMLGSCSCGGARKLVEAHWSILIMLAL